jgi:hypothetical protein
MIAKGRRKFFPLLTKGDEGGLDIFFQTAKASREIKGENNGKVRNGNRFEEVHRM